MDTPPAPHTPDAPANDARDTAAPDTAARDTAAPANGLVIVITNVPDEDTAQEIADALVGERLAACVNILAPCTSIYRWQGEVENAEEVPLMIKTVEDRLDALQRRLDALHPYDVPEIVAWRPHAVLPAYAAWAVSETRPDFR